MDLLLHRLATPLLAPFEQGSDFFWAFLLCYAAVALLLYLRRGGGAGFLRFLLPREVYGHGSARLDVAVWAINAVIFATPAAAVISAVDARMQAALTALIGAPPFALAAGGLWDHAYTLALFAAADLGIYLGHLLLHRSAVLWEFHKLHHSARVLIPFTAYRQHPVDGLVTGMASGICAGLVAGLFNWFAPGGLNAVTLLQHNMADLAFIAAGIHFRHSHLWLDYGAGFNRVLMSPCMHHVHHSDDPRHYGKNLGLALSLWDHLFGTALVPAGPETYRFGLGDEDADYQSLAGAYFTPFRKAARLLAERLRRRVAVRQNY